MATPEVRQAQAVNDGREANLAPPEAEEPDNAGKPGDAWWNEFVPVEKVFSVVSWLVIAGAAAMFLGHWIEIYPITVVGIVVFTAGLVGIASLGYPLARITIMAISDWRRQRSTKHTCQV